MLTKFAKIYVHRKFLNKSLAQDGKRKGDVEIAVPIKLALRYKKKESAKVLLHCTNCNKHRKEIEWRKLALGEIDPSWLEGIEWVHLSHITFFYYNNYSYHNLFYLILSYSILFYNILSNLILPYPILSYHPIVNYCILSYPVMSYYILSYPILFYLILSYLHRIVLSYSTLSYPNLSYPILFYPILFYPILFYPILSSSFNLRVFYYMPTYILKIENSKFSDSIESPLSSCFASSLTFAVQ